LFGVIIGFALLGLVLAPGCTKKETFKSKKGNVTVEQRGKKGKVTVETGEGKTEIETGESLPKDWPADMPVYKPAKIVGSSAIKGQGDTTSLSLALESSDAVDKIREFYQKNLASNGWEVNESASTALEGNESALLTAAKQKRSSIITMGKAKAKEKTELVIQIFTQ
jgi:hypothetical protein